MKYTYIYVILGICAVAVSIGKALAVNFGISKYLSKKSYNGKFKVIKTASISFGVGYILLALASLFIVTMMMDAIYSHIRFDELLQDFLSIFYMAIIGANYEFLDSPYGLGLIYVFPFIFVIIVSIVVLIFVNYTFVYRKFGIPNNKNGNSHFSPHLQTHRMNCWSLTDRLQVWLSTVWCFDFVFKEVWLWIILKCLTLHM